jgi:hypothetical protein
VPADDKLLEVQGDTPYFHLGGPLADAANLIPSTSCRPRIYCNRTATGLVQASTQRTQQLLDVGKNAAKRLNFRTCQYGMKWRMRNLQGGGRWFEPSIAHLEKSCKGWHFAGKKKGPENASRPFYCNRTATRTGLGSRDGPQRRFHRFDCGVLHVGQDM